MTTIAPKHILVVDDDDMNRELMEAFLASENYTVALAHSGKVALQMASELHPDLVILDVRMPDMSGYEVCQQLKSEPQTQAIAVIIVTGFDGREDRERAAEVGADAFVSRPFGADELIERVRDLLGN